jgi:predicted phage tail protein
MSPLNKREIEESINDIEEKNEANKLYMTILNESVMQTNKELEFIKKILDKQNDKQNALQNIMMGMNSEFSVSFNNLTKKIDEIQEHKKSQLEKLIYPIIIVIITFSLTQVGNFLFKFVIKGTS